MKKQNNTNSNNSEESYFNVAIVGGGRTSKKFSKLLQSEPFSSMNIRLVGVCDIDPEAKGLRLASEAGIYTTNDFRALFEITGLDAIVELTNKREVLLELIQLKPKGLAVLGHNVSRLLENISVMNQRMESAEQQARLEKRTSDYLIQQSNDRVVVLEPEFTIVDANEAYLKAVKKAKHEVIGAHCYEITHGLDVPCSSTHPKLGCPLMETQVTGETAHVIHEHPTDEGHPTYSSMVTYPLKDENGKIVRVIEIWNDITDVLSSRLDKRIKALQSDYKKLVQEDRLISLGKLVASSVHEINNPIQGLLTFSHLMQKILEENEPGPNDLKEFKKYLSLMSGELERCGNIISGLLSFSRQSFTAYKDINLTEVLEDVITLTRHKMELQNIRLNIRFPSVPLILFGDINQLQQCFLNLIFNAIEAMPRGGELSVISEFDGSGKHIILEFKDTGCGIRAGDLDHIFDPFFTTKAEGEGTGLGLSIVHGIVKAHKGTIKVKSRVEKGSSFVLKFLVQ